MFSAGSLTLPVLLHAGCAALYLALVLAVLVSLRPDPTGCALVASCLVTAAWAGNIAFGTAGPLADGLDLARPVVWSGFLLHLYARSVPDGSRVARLLCGLGLLMILVAALAIDVPGLRLGVVPAGIAARLGLAVCMILLTENLYRSAGEDLRWHIILPCVALGGLGVYDIALYSDATLFGRIAPALVEGRAAMMALLVPLLALAALRHRRRWTATLRVSHGAVFYSASLVLIGVFLLAVSATGEVLRQLGSDRGAEWGVVLEVSLICGGLLAAGVFLTSGSARSSLRHLLVSNFLTHRYDYRQEWLRCIRTLSDLHGHAALETRAIKALAQVVDSPAGLVFLRSAEDSVFRWEGSWNLPAAGPITADHPLVPRFRDGAWVVQAPDAAPWLDALPELWLAVPLAHSGRLMGFTLLARPRVPFALDGEVFALLRTVGQEVASTIAERRAAETLLQTAQLREYGQRFAFVAHDIKNVANQLALVLANAEHHISNPAFQQDMLATVGGSVQKISALLARLKLSPDAPGADPSAPGAPGADPSPPESGQAPTVQGVGERLTAIVDAAVPSRRARLRLELGSAGAAAIVMPPAAFEAVITHLLNNAFEASAADAPVRIVCRREGGRVLVDVIDGGTGMTPEFIRTQLFRPFISSKAGGSGIGAFQARALLRQAGGDLIVTSTPGVGTTMRLSLPRAAVAAPALLETTS